MDNIGPFTLDTVVSGDCRKLIEELPDESIDVVVTSPPYWGQRVSEGVGVENDPREYLGFLNDIFVGLLSKIKPQGIVWINLGDAFNTPINWRENDRQYSTLGADKKGLNENNSAYTKPRAKRKAYIDRNTGWLKYGNCLNLPSRLVNDLVDNGYFYRGEVIWRKINAMPEGRCRRPHRQHEPIYLLARNQSHSFRVSPPVPSIWEFPNEKINGKAHFSRFPEELPKRCIEAYGSTNNDVIILDPFAGSGTTNLVAHKLKCRHLGFEIDSEHAHAANERIRNLKKLEVTAKKKNPAIYEL